MIDTQLRTIKTILCLATFFVIATDLIVSRHVDAKAQQPAFTASEKAIVDQIKQLRSLPDEVRARTTKQLAIDIRRLPVTVNKFQLATALANLSTEGDFGHDALQEVATTLAEALREQPLPMQGNQPAYPYVELAQLVRYEHVQATLDNPQFAAAMAKLEADDQQRQHPDFTLT